MSSTFLNQIGLGEFDLGYLLVGSDFTVDHLFDPVDRSDQKNKQIKKETGQIPQR